MEQLALRLSHCLPTQQHFPPHHAPPALFFIQDPPVSWYPGKITGAGSSFPVYQTIANRYKSFFLDLNTLGNSEVNSAHWPHPHWHVHQIHADYLTDVFLYIDENGGGDADNNNNEDNEDYFCSTEPVTSETERVEFRGCNRMTTFMGGQEGEYWDIAVKDIGWSLSHNDVPTRPDKTGYLYDSLAPGAEAAYAGGGDNSKSQISFNIRLGSQRMMTFDFLHSYEHIGYARCHLENYKTQTYRALEGFWNSQVSLTSTNTFRFYDIISEAEAESGEYVFTCIARAPTNYVVNAFPYHFKIMGLATC